MNYYNEFNPKAAAALRQLISDKLLPFGIVDERSIKDVKAEELKGFTQCHFFAGIGGWSYALQLAGWPSNRSVWTGSCPCQPFSSAGKQKGKEDERHLWPVWFSLIRQSRPEVVFGEQVSAAIRHNWWDDVADDLERDGYTTRAEIRPACSVGAPHKRDRLWFVAYRNKQRCYRESVSIQQGQEKDTEINRYGECGSMVNPQYDGQYARPVVGSNGTPISNNTKGENCTIQSTGTSESCNVAKSDSEGLQGYRGLIEQYGAQGRQDAIGLCAENSFWNRGAEQWIDCPDGKQRLIEPSICLLANGFSERVGLISAGGNAIVPQVAAEFIKEHQEYERFMKG
jgi:DNA (cytosine-5)-methyltransferase 1